MGLDRRAGGGVGGNAETEQRELALEVAARTRALRPAADTSKFQAGNIIQGRGPRMAKGEVTPPSFAVGMARKDVSLMMEAARGQPLVALPGVAKRMDAVIEAGGGEHDLAALANPRG